MHESRASSRCWYPRARRDTAPRRGGSPRREIEPEAHDAEDFLQYPRIVKIQIGLMRVEAMPVIGFRHRIPSPVRLLCIDKDDPSVRICVVVVGPDIIAPRKRAGLRMASTLKPRMLIGGVIDYQL